MDRFRAKAYFQVSLLVYDCIPNFKSLAQTVLKLSIPRTHTHTQTDRHPAKNHFFGLRGPQFVHICQKLDIENSGRKHNFPISIG